MCANVEHETAEGDMLLAVSYEAQAPSHQARFQDELKNSQASVDIAFREFCNCRALHEAASVDLEVASQRTIELKRKTDDADDRTRSHRERCRRARKDHMMAEEVLNNSLGCLGDLARDSASATHALSCEVPDRDSNETKYLREALEMIDEWQAHCSRRSSEDHDGHETAEVVLVDRPQ